MIVVGGGDTATDAARMNKRLGAEVIILTADPSRKCPPSNRRSKARSKRVSIFNSWPRRSKSWGTTGRRRVPLHPHGAGRAGRSGRRRPVQASSELDVGYDSHCRHQPGAGIRRVCSCEARIGSRLTIPEHARGRRVCGRRRCRAGFGDDRHRPGPLAADAIDARLRGKELAGRWCLPRSIPSG